MPDLDPSDIVSYTRLDPESADRIRDYYDQFEYVSREFAEFALMWEVLVRLGDVRLLDLDDYNREALLGKRLLVERYLAVLQSQYGPRLMYFSLICILAYNMD